VIDEAASPPETLRADKWLWHARLCKTRTLAAKIIDDGKLRVNGVRAAKPSASLRPGDVLTVVIHGRVRVVRILGLGARRGPAPEAEALYEDLTPAPTANDALQEEAMVDPGTRPGKRERRARDKLHRFDA